MTESTNAAPAAPAETQEAANTETIQENQTESTENVENAAAPAEQTPKEAKKAAKIEKQLKKLKLKVDGQEEEVEFDPNDEEFLTRELQIARMGRKRAQEHAELQKNIRIFAEELKNNPRKILADPTIGIDLKKLAAEIIEEEIENSKKSPEQLEKEKLQAELQAIKDEREREKDENRKKDFARLQEYEFERYDTLMTKTLEKSDLPKSDFVIKRMADYMLEGLKAGYDITPDDVLPIVQREIEDDVQKMLGVMSDERIEKLLGKEIFDRFRKKNLAKAKAKNAPPVPVKSAVKDVAASKAEASPAVKKTIREMWGV